MRADGDADAGTGQDAMPVEVEGFRHRLDDAVGEGGGVLRCRERAVQYRELVAAEASDGIAAAADPAEAGGDVAEDSVADAVPEQVVDRLEVV